MKYHIFCFVVIQFCLNVDGIFVRYQALAVNAPVAQLDRASDFGSEGRGFESSRAYHKKKGADIRPPFQEKNSRLLIIHWFEELGIQIKFEFGILIPTVSDRNFKGIHCTLTFGSLSIVSFAPNFY